MIAQNDSFFLLVQLQQLAVRQTFSHKPATILASTTSVHLLLTAKDETTNSKEANSINVEIALMAGVTENLIIP